jgi:hypothetical protein
MGHFTLYVKLHNENHIYDFGDFHCFFLSFLTTENLQNHSFVDIFILQFGDISPF